MNHKKHGYGLAGILVVAVLLSACTQSVSQAPLATPTLIGTGLFVSPFPSVENPMEMIEEFAKGTATAAAAQTQAAGGTPGTPGTPSGTVLTPAGASVTPGTPGTPTNQGVVTVAVTPNTPVITPGGPTVTQQPKPASYTLQKGEFPYCIARRFNVNPDELLTLNGITNGQIFYPNLTLKIPQTGNPFPADRALRPHPGSYTVTASDETVYGVACKFGDVDPAAIAAANGIAVSAALTAGQVLTIP